jgi:hypothetical protein
MPQGRKIRIPGLRRFKLFLGAVLLILYTATGLMSLSGGSYGAILFLATAFILLDYLWVKRKRRHFSQE